jgi:flavin reductase (DIM6/NTAB) family NADH-FMN oxidoreductase RutF
MKLVQKVLNKINGLHYPQEYLCFAKENFQHPLHAWLVDNKQRVKDITNEHLFTGYCPLVFTLFTTASGQSASPVIDVIFHPSNEFPGKKAALARLSLQLIHQQKAGDINILYYEGINGEHRFLSAFHQYIIGLYNRLYNKKKGNVFLHDNLYKQVQIAYALPRIISLITVSDGQSYNLFPTDLHGPVNEQYYVCSLRHEGKACRQVEAARKIVISQVEHTAYKTVYSLGKNHMQELKPKGNFPFGDSLSPLFQLPLPQPALYYRELELVDSFTHGIHKLLLFKVVASGATKYEPSTLAHIHNVYATWRHNKGLSGNYLLR